MYVGETPFARDLTAFLFETANYEYPIGKKKHTLMTTFVGGGINHYTNTLCTVQTKL
jgi:hypothetical protein